MGPRQGPIPEGERQPECWAHPAAMYCLPGPSQTSRGERQQAEIGQVLPVIPHPRIERPIEIHKAKNRKERTHEEQESGQWCAGKSSQEPKRGDQRKHPKWEEPLPPHRRLRCPFRIYEVEAERPDEFPQVEPHRPASDKQTSRPRQRKVRALGPEVVLFHPNGEKPRRSAQSKPGEQWAYLAPAEPATLPPYHHQQGRRQRCRDGLAPQREYEQGQRGRIRPRPARPVESEVDQRRRQVEDERKCVFLLRNPSHRFDVHRVQREQQRRQPSPWHGQPLQDQREENCRARMQQQGDQMVAERLVSPEPVLHPEHAMQQRIILLGRSRFDPYPAEAGQRAQSRSGHIVTVVPNESARERRPVGHNGRADQQRSCPKIPQPGWHNVQGFPAILSASKHVQTL